MASVIVVGEEDEKALIDYSLLLQRGFAATLQTATTAPTPRSIPAPGAAPNALAQRAAKSHARGSADVPRARNPTTTRLTGTTGPRWAGIQAMTRMKATARTNRRPER